MPSVSRLIIRGVPLLLLFLLIRAFWNWKQPTARPQQFADEAKPTVDVQPDPAYALIPLTFTALPLGSIKPEGWMKDQMVAMANGLPGSLAEFYKFVAESSWVGGHEEYSDLNEGFPYWYNGLVPLAYSLGDERLKMQVHAATDYVLAHQAEDGWLGPENGTDRVFWGRYPLCLGLMQLVDANATYEATVVPALHRFADLMHQMLIHDYSGYKWRQGDVHSELSFSWGRVRYADMIIPLQWLYENHPRHNAAMLLETMMILHDGSHDWTSWYREGVYIQDDLYKLPKEATERNFHFLHAVNVGQGLKAAAVVRRFLHNDSLLQTAGDGVRWTFKYHGAASGTIIGDERIDGLAAWSGSELCTTVETMYSLTYLYHALGESDYADRCERTAFNALPAMISPDWWSHQYVAQTNQPFSHVLNPNPFYNTNAISNSFGLEPHYPCCTVNNHQGFPKYLSHSWVRMGPNGIGHALLGPSSVDIRLSVGRITIKCTTNYPFSGKIYYTINSPGPFDFYMRVPNWATDRSNFVKDNPTAFALSPDPHTGMHHIAITFRGITEIVYDLKANIVTHPRANDTVTVNHGALLYALDIEASAIPGPPKRYNDQTAYPEDYAPPKVHDWVLDNKNKWNIAIDPTTISGFSVLDNSDKVKFQAPLNDPVFAPGGSPTWVTVKACPIQWDTLGKGGPPGPVPPLDQRKCIGEVFTAKLVPYGAAKLHMAELPTIDLSPNSQAIPHPEPPEGSDEQEDQSGEDQPDGEEEPEKEPEREKTDAEKEAEKAADEAAHKEAEKEAEKLKAEAEKADKDAEKPKVNVAVADDKAGDKADGKEAEKPKENPDDKKPDDKKPEEPKGDDKKPEDPKPDDKKPDDKKPEEKAGDKPADGDKKADEKPGDSDKKADDKAGDGDKKPDDKKPDDKKPDEKPADKDDGKKPAKRAAQAASVL